MEMRTIAKLFCTQIVRIFTFSVNSVYFSVFSTAKQSIDGETGKIESNMFDT